MTNRNIVLTTDSYKPTHSKLYKPGTTYMQSYLESRVDNPEAYNIFFGLQYIMKKYLEGEVVNVLDVRVAEMFFEKHFGRKDAFDSEGWKHICMKHGGRLPIRIWAQPEGAKVPARTPLIVVESTDPEAFWVVNYLETLLSQVWYPTTIATSSYMNKETIRYFLKETSDLEGEALEGDLAFRLHDFGFRGVSSTETAGIGGMANLAILSGTDNLEGILYAREFYPGPESGAMHGFSIPASEHSTMTSWGGREGEAEAMENMLDTYPTGPIACVSDSYDIEHAIRQTWGRKLKDKILERDGVLVVRPDCYSEDTKILTQDGWKYFKNLNDDDKVAQVLEDGTFEFTDYTNYVSEEYEGDMIRFFDFHGKLDLVVTPNHRMVRVSDGKMEVQTAEDIKYYHNKDLLRSAKSKNGKYSKLTNLDKLKIAFQADGSFTTSGNKIRFSFSKERKKERLLDILSKLSIEPIIYDLKGERVEIVVDIDSSLFEKNLNWVNIKNLNFKWCREFIEELSYWDATRRSKNRFKFDTTTKEVIDVVELITLSAGYGVLISEKEDKRKEVFSNVFTAHILKTPIIGGQSIQKETISYSGKVYCVTVPSGKLMVKRRRGTVISGNSGDPVKATLKVVEALWDSFGGERNSKGYKVLNPKVRMIQGDGIDRCSIRRILSNFKENGFSTENITLGSGGGLLQKFNRDTFRFAFKCNKVITNGEEVDVRKFPKEYNSKGEYVQSNKFSKSGDLTDTPGLIKVFENGEILKEWTFDEVRENAKS